MKYISAVTAPNPPWMSRPIAVGCRPPARLEVAIVAINGASVINPNR